MAGSDVNVLVTIPLDEDHIQKLRGVSPRLTINLHPARKPDEILPEIWEKAEVLYTDIVLPEPDIAQNLRWIQFHWAGIDRMADHPLLDDEEINVTTMSGASASQMGEYVLTALLALGHHLPAAAAAQRNAEWPADRWERYLPQELRGSTVGLVGYGSVGRQVARLLQPFGAIVLAAKHNAMQPEDQGYAAEDLGDPEGDLPRRIYPYQALPSMLKDCDFVVVAGPLTAETRGLLDAEAFSAMKTSTYLVDVSRGGIVDHQALIKALKSGRLAGAMLDVFPQEPLPADSPLWKMPNVFITPHISGISQHYDERAVALFVENLHRYLGGLPLYNRYVPERGY
jgi:phosphoglycerate dehydrogenase-like enzyme